MKYLIMFLLLGLNIAFADFEKEAAGLANELKSNLVKNLNEKLAKEGAVSAIAFCHENVKKLAKDVAGKRLDKYEFGRTSHKVRNSNNVPSEWMKIYLQEFQGTMMTSNQKRKVPIIGTIEGGKKFYLEPLYIRPLCLNCHGTEIKNEVIEKVRALYPKDQATGFKLNEFRGFIWVKEK